MSESLADAAARRDTWATRWLAGSWDRGLSVAWLSGLLVVAVAAGPMATLVPAGPEAWVRATQNVVVQVALVVAIALPVGCALGAVAALGPRVCGGLLAHAVELTGALPSLILLGLWRVSSDDPTLGGFVIILCVLKAIETARIIAELANSTRQREFVLAARALGASPSRVFRAHVLPRLFPALAVSAASAAVYVVGLEAALSFVGLGPRDVVSWGTLLGRAATGGDVSVGLFWGCAASLAVTTLALNALVRPHRR